MIEAQNNVVDPAHLNVGNVVVDYVAPSSVTPSPTPVPSPIYQQTLLQDDFSGTSLNTSNWKVDKGTVTVSNGAAVLPATTFDANAFSSVAAWARTDASGHQLRVTYNMDFGGGCPYSICGLNPNTFLAANDYTNCKYGWGLLQTQFQTAAGLVNGYLAMRWDGAWGQNECGAAVVSTGTNHVRMTLDPVQGALWEIDSGSDFTVFDDTRGKSSSKEDTATKAFVLRFTANADNAGDAGSCKVSNVLVEYVTPAATPTATATPTPTVPVELSSFNLE